MKYKAYIGSRNYTDVPLARDSNLMHQKHELTPTQAQFLASYPYTEIVGALLYLSALTSADIAYAV